MDAKRDDSLSYPIEGTRDDFKLIRGIGPALENRLHTAGIQTYTELGAMTPKELARVFDGFTGLTAESITKREWIEKARQLASLQATKTDHDQGTSPRRQHYAIFTVELLLDEDNEVRRTRLTHIQSQEEKTWAGWDELNLIKFLKGHASLKTPASAEVFSQTDRTEGSQQPEAEREVYPEELTQSGEEVGPWGKLHITNLETVSGEFAILRDHPFSLHLILDLSQVSAEIFPLYYSAQVFGKNMSNGTKYAIGEVQGILIHSDRAPIPIEGTALPEGIYRLEAVVILSHPIQREDTKPELMTMLEGGLLQVS